MKSQEEFKFSNSVVLVPVAFTLLIWLVFWVEIRFRVNFTVFGIFPQKLSGLRGVIFSPFIHSGITHLYHNTIPLFVLTAGLFYFYRQMAWKILILGIILSGLLTWGIGRPAYHIGISGLIYVLVSFLFFKGIITKHFRLIALSLLVIFLYGSMIWYVLPIKDGVSWEGHLSGLIVGFVFAFIFKKDIPKPSKYHWEQPSYNEADDPFLKHFDADGNFVESQPEPETVLPEKSENNSQGLTINYIFKKSDD
ncbi:rhomboid family intramembrane serine protease [Bizionia argentinensis JUB59]|uniref:Rhomboid family intramembrane serine protease n=1 Tax=Bizionia argentinensis JUB59 TaxID=1046627 RepID=G2EBL0_9FLAO|nr:rhomboid family intramembrane serine protease [Bizionia argentinensis]EGV44137.1 rhomboid family intramembrane serine protease [Bizionia argentinensis JUB59]